MRKHTWMGLGVAALGMGLVLGAQPSAAQSSSDVSSQGMTDMQSQPSSMMSQSEAQQRLEVARLRTQVAQLQQQLAQMRTQLAQAQSGAAMSSSAQGVGGSGTAGSTGALNDNSSGSSAVGYPSSESGVGYTSGTGGSGDPAGNDVPGYALANVLHTGRVRSVSQGQLVLDEGGGTSTTLSLANTVRVFREGKPSTLQSLEAGTRVKTSADFYARGNPVTRIEVLSPP